MVDPKRTNFRSIIEQSAQGSLRTREEMIAAEVAQAPQVVVKIAEIPRVIPVQDRSSPEAQDARERGLLVLEHAQRIVDHLQDDPNILNMARLSEDNPDRSQMSPRNLEFIDLDDITRLDDLELKHHQLDR
jgi:hypothetical protein